MSESRVSDSWQEFLDPEILRSKLVAASLYLAAFELLKASIVDRLREFYTSEFDEAGAHPDPAYASEVLSRNPSAVYASLSWLQESRVIEQSDIDLFETLKNCRNQIAHELPQIIFPGGSQEHLNLFPGLLALLRKVELWWILNVELATDPDLCSADIDEDEIIPGPMAIMKMMIDIALGSTSEAGVYLKEFRAWQRGQGRSDAPN